MATLKLRKPAAAAGTPPAQKRAPVRGHANRARPTLKEAQTQRTEREAFAPAAHVSSDADKRHETQARLDSQARRDTQQPGDIHERRDARDPRHSHDTREQRDPRETRDARHQRPASAASSAKPGRPVDRGPRREPDRTTDRPGGRATDHANDRKTQHPTHRPDSRADPRAGPQSRRPAAGHANAFSPNREAAPRRSPAEARSPIRAQRAPPTERETTRHAPTPADDTLRLSKRMSQLGIASRREADEWIAKGWVRVDGRIVNELGSRVLPEQHITVDAKARREQDARVTVLVNKPVGFVSGQAEDGYEPAIVLVTPENQWRDDRSGTRYTREHLRSLVPAGRLDIDSVGLLVLTQDGRVARQLIGEDSAIEKEYLVRVVASPDAPVADDVLERLRDGLELDGEALRPAQVDWLNEDQLRFVLTQGKKRQIRRMCEAVGLQVIGLKRVRIGAVMLGDLPPGQWRYLRADETFAPR